MSGKNNQMGWGSAILFFIIGVIAVDMLSGGDSTPTPSSSNGYTNTPDDTAIKYTAQRRLKSILRDPDSLEIIEEQVIRPGRNGSDVGYWCRYRTKNGFGGYISDEYYTE